MAIFEGPTLGIVVDDIDGRLCVITGVMEAGEAAGVKLGYAVTAINDTPIADLGVVGHFGLEVKLGKMTERPIKLTLLSPPVQDQVPAVQPQIVAIFEGPTLGIVVDDIDGRLCVITGVMEAGEAAGVKLGYAVTAINDTPIADLGVVGHFGLEIKLGKMTERPIKLTLDAPPAAGGGAST